MQSAALVFSNKNISSCSFYFIYFLNFIYLFILILTQVFFSITLYAYEQWMV